MPGATRWGVCHTTGMGYLLSDLILEAVRVRKEGSTVPLLTTLLRCSPFFTSTSVSRSVSSRSSPAWKVTSQILSSGFVAGPEIGGCYYRAATNPRNTPSV